MRFILLFLLVFPGIASATKIGDYEIIDYKRVNNAAGGGYFEVTVQYRDANGEVITGGKERILDHVISDEDGMRIEKIEKIFSEKLGRFVAIKNKIGAGHDGQDLEALKSVRREIENKVVGAETEGLILGIAETQTLAPKLIWLDESRTDASVVSFKSLDESVATVNARGEVTGVKAGETDIAVSADGHRSVTRVIVE